MLTKTPTALVSGGSGTKRKVMAQQGSISSLGQQKKTNKNKKRTSGPGGVGGAEQSRLSHDVGELYGLVHVRGVGEWSSHTQHALHLRLQELIWHNIMMLFCFVFLITADIFRAHCCLPLPSLYVS